MSTELKLTSNSDLTLLVAALVRGVPAVLSGHEEGRSIDLELDEDRTVVFENEDGEACYIGFDNLAQYAAQGCQVSLLTDNLAPFENDQAYQPITAHFDAPEWAQSELQRLAQELSAFCRLNNMPHHIAVVHGIDDDCERALLRHWAPEPLGRKSYMTSRLHRSATQNQDDSLERLLAGVFS